MATLPTNTKNRVWICDVDTLGLSLSYLSYSITSFQDAREKFKPRFKVVKWQDNTISFAVYPVQAWGPTRPQIHLVLLPQVRERHDSMPGLYTGAGGATHKSPGLHSKPFAHGSLLSLVSFLV